MHIIVHAWVVFGIAVGVERLDIKIMALMLVICCYALLDVERKIVCCSATMWGPAIVLVRIVCLVLSVCHM